MKKTIGLLAIAMAACGDDRPPPPPVQQVQTPAQAAPVVVNNGGNGAGDALLGMAAGGALGYMAGRASSQPQQVQQPTQVIERHYTTRVIEKAAPPQAQTPKPLAVPESKPEPPKTAAAPQVTPKVTYSTNFTQKPSTPPPRVSTPSYTSRPGAYSRR